MNKNSPKSGQVDGGSGGGIILDQGVGSNGSPNQVHRPVKIFNGARKYSPRSPNAISSTKGAGLAALAGDQIIDDPSK